MGSIDKSYILYVIFDKIKQFAIFFRARYSESNHGF